MMKLKTFFKNLFRKGRPCVYCGLKTQCLGRVYGSAYAYRVCEDCQQQLNKGKK